MFTIRTSVIAAALTAGTALSAQAGGYIAPIVETEVEAIAPVGDWQGAYAGLTLGYAFSGDDRVGWTDTADSTFIGTPGKLELSGANVGLRAGYRWQKDNWVFGPELGFEAGSIEDTLTYDNESGGTTNVDSKIKNVLSLRLKTGYAVKPDMLVYGIVGVARADIEYRTSADDDAGVSVANNQDFKKTGYVIGLGVEKQLTERMSLTGEYEYANFGKTTRNFTLGDETASTQATPDYHNIKLGLNFRF